MPTGLSVVWAGQLMVASVRLTTSECWLHAKGKCEDTAIGMAGACQLDTLISGRQTVVTSKGSLS